MSIGGMCYTFWIMCFLLPSYYAESLDKGKMPWYLNKTFIKVLMIVTAGINGIGAGILWVAQGKYISTCASEQNKGFYNGYFWAIMVSSFVFGNIIGVVVLKDGSKKSTLFEIFAALAVIGSLTFCTLGSPDKLESDNIEEPLLDNNEAAPIEESNPIQDIKDTYRLLWHRKMWHAMPLMLWTSMSLSIYASVFIPLLTRSM